MKKVTSIVLALTMLFLFVLISSCENRDFLTENNQISERESLYRWGTVEDPCEDPFTRTLYAGKNIPVGKIIIVDDGVDNFTVTYKITDPNWCITETHLHVAENLGDLPLTKKNNLIPGQFDYKMEHDPCVEEYTYDPFPIPGGYNCEKGIDFVVAAHAVVQNQNEVNVDCIDFESYEEYDEIGNVSTGAGDVGFYMTNHTVLEGIVLGDPAALAPTGNLPVIAEPLNKDPDTNTMYDPTQNIVAFTVGNTFKDDWVSADPQGTGAGGKLLGDTPDFTKAPFWQHAYSNLQAILMDFSNINNLSGVKFAGIDLDWNEVWYVLYFDSDNKLIHKKTLGPPSGQTQDGEAILIEYSNPNIAKVVIWGNMNGGTPGKVGYAIDNICITTFGEETAWGEGEDPGGKDWSMYIEYDICCPPPYAECKLYLGESFGGTNDGSIIYTVDVSDNTYAHLTEEIDLTGQAKWDKPHLAVDPVSGLLYLINNGNDCHLGTWDGSTLIDLGAVSGLPNASASNPGTVLAAFSDDGRLFVANATTERIYEIDPTGGPAVIDYWDTGINISGADMAFKGDDLFIYTNSNKTLYKITSLNGDGSVTKETVGTVGTGSVGFTGLAYGGCTNDKLLGSSNTDDILYEINTSNGSTSAAYPFKLGGSDYYHIYGDMASGH